jgi:eukaryotic-like serine/threonine-protein kinase
LDFNLSVEDHFNSSRIGGTLPYMAPEQLEFVMLDEESDGSVRTDPQTDIYSLGVILYQLLSGELPFKSVSWDSPLEQVAGQLLKEQEKGPCSLRKKNQHVDQRLSQLIQDCMSYNPKQRPKSASELIKALRKELTPLRRSIRWYDCHRWLAGLIASSLLMIILLSVSFFAFRAPYSIRQFQSGLQFYNKGEFELAKTYFSESLHANANQPQVLFARGRAYQKVNNYLLANDDFKESFRLSPKAETSACMGYCMSKLRYHNVAIELYKQSISMGYQSPFILNNLGFSYCQINAFDDATHCLEQALSVDDNLQPAHHTLVLIYLRQALNGHSLSESAFGHAQKAIDLGPPSADLYFNVALLYAFAAKQRPALRQSAIGYLNKALEYGTDPKVLNSTPAFSVLQDEQQFKDLLTTAQSKVPLIKSEYLVDPLENH